MLLKRLWLRPVSEEVAERLGLLAVSLDARHCVLNVVTRVISADEALEVEERLGRVDHCVQPPFYSQHLTTPTVTAEHILEYTEL